ncbi:MAG: hypothetical protein U9O82_02285 [Thermodesulfobacteriota bacterium]|nr:hypothetical protein [Thermodesulfobacteriota bacterium]
MFTKYFSFWRIFFISLCCLLIFGTGQGLAASFLADMVVTEKGKQTISKFFLLDNQYRMDTEDDGMALTILVNRENKKTRVIVSSRKTYLEFANDDLRSLLKNPFEAHLFSMEIYNVKTLGREIVNNINCDKQEIEYDGKVVMTAWVSLKYNFPIKILNNRNNYVAELQGIRKAHLNSNFFKVPSDFVKQEEPEPKKVKPKEKISIKGKESFKAPIGRRIGPGGILSVTVSPEKHIDLILRNENDGVSIAVIHTLKNNKPVIVKAMGDKTIEFKKIWDKKEISFEKPSNPDLLEVEVSKGMVYVIVNQESPMWEKEQLHENFLKEPIDFGFLTRPKLRMVCQLTGDSQDEPESRLKVTFFKDKYKTPVLSEEISLKNGQSRQWEFDAGHNILSGKVEVQKGSVQFSLHQFPKKQSTVKKKSKPKYTPKVKPDQSLPLKTAPGPKENKVVAAAVGADKQTASSSTILNGDVPLYKGARVVKEKAMGANSQVDLEVPASPEEVVNFYKQAMTAKGWQSGMAMVQGSMGVLQLKKDRSLITLKATGNGQKSMVKIAFTTY